MINPALPEIAMAAPAKLHHALGHDLSQNASASTGGNRLMNDGYVVPSSTLFAGSIGVRKGDLQLSLFGENLGDSRRPTFARNTTLVAGPFPEPSASAPPPI